MLNLGSFSLTLALALTFTPNLALANSSINNPLAVNSTGSSTNQEAFDPSKFNVLILSDERILIMLAALNIAGYDYEPDGEIKGLRAQLRNDLKSTPPELVARLRNYYASHRLEGREAIAQVSPYIGLALTLSGPPSLSTPQVIEKLPPDVKQVIDFVPLLQEFYVRSPIKELLPKYKATLGDLRAQYERTAGTVLYETLAYLRTQPVLFLPPTPIFNSEEDELPGNEPAKADKPDEPKAANSKDKSKLDKNKITSKDVAAKKDKDKDAVQKLSAPRTRRLLIFLNPFSASGSIFERNDLLNGADIETSRRLGDEYSIVVSQESLTDQIRHGFLRFVLDPIVGKNSVEIANLKEQIDPLLANLPRARERARRNVYEVVGESLARAVGVRLTARTAGASFNADDANYLLAQHYEQGAVLIFHFYNCLLNLERVGIDIRDFFPSLLVKIDFEKEGKRLDEVKEARARVEQKRNSVKSIIDVDLLIKQRDYVQAKAQLETILKEQPKNARALFGMAQIVNNQISETERDPVASDDDKIAAQEERLANAAKLYRDAIAAANPQEQWLVSQCHVLIGRILDFVEQRDAAIGEYEKAIQLGDIPKGAYREAVEGKAKPYVPGGR